MAGVRGNVAAAEQGPVLFSSSDGLEWHEHDLAALGIPRATLCGTDDERVCHPAALLLTAADLPGDGTGEIAVIVDSAAGDEPIVRDRWVVRGTAAGLTATETTVDDDGWPVPADGGAWSGATPRVAALVDDRLLAVAPGSNGAAAAPILHTIDGGGHTTVTLPFGDTGRSSIDALTHTAAGYLAVGTAPGAEQRGLPTVWRSTDGVEWHAALLDAGHDDTDSNADFAINGIADGPAGVVVLGRLRPDGFGGDSHPVFWHSADGDTWVETVAAELGPMGVGGSIVALSDRYIARIVGELDLATMRLTTSVAESFDGQHWTLLTDDARASTMIAWGDGLAGVHGSDVVISRPGFGGGTDAADAAEVRPVTITRAVDPAGPADVGRFWRRVELPDGLSINRAGAGRVGGGRIVGQAIAVAGAHAWLTATRDDALTLLSSGDGATWVEHDLAAAGVPEQWLLAGSSTDEASVTSLLVPDGDEIVLILSRYPVDNDTIPPQLLTVRSDGTALDVRPPEAFTLGAWPGPSNGDDLRYGAPWTGLAHDGRLVLAGSGQWWQPLATGDRSIVATVIEPDGTVAFVAHNGPPFGGRAWQQPLAVLRVDERFLLIGTGEAPEPETRQMNTWTSTDALDWTGPHIAGAGGPLWDAPDGIVSGPTGLLAWGEATTFGSEIRPIPAMWWHSPDGQAWNRVVPDAAGPLGQINAAWVHDGQYHSHVSSGALNVLLSSPDGIDWQRTASNLPAVHSVVPWNDGLIGIAGDQILVSRPGFTGGELIGG